MAFLDDKELKSLGLKSIGKNVSISDKASFYNPGNIAVGNSVRIDDFCILSAGPGGIHIGNNVHIACYCSIVGQGRVILEDFSGISARVSVFSSSDDYSGEHMTAPTIPEEYRKVDAGDVIIGKHAVIGVGTVILANVAIETGAAVGALHRLITPAVEARRTSRDSSVVPRGVIIV